jgi:cytochrome c peroxidase
MRPVYGAGALLATVAGAVLIVFTVAYAAERKNDPASALETMKADYQRPSEIPTPKDNSYSPERAELGKSLFFDPRLSGSGAISCASCHNPALGWSDGLPTGIGHMGSRLGRHSPAVEDLAWGGPYFWDGRAATLEDQAKGPLQAGAEMNMPLANVVRTVVSIPGYKTAFAAAYPGEPINIEIIAKAIANFERTIVSGKAPFDLWIEGDEHAIGEAAKRGFVLFNTKGDCATCHSSWRFSDDGFHDIGVKSNDKGRGAVNVGNPVVEYAFKTPSLRNTALRAPYMHDGSEKSLRAVIDFYDGGFIERKSLSPHIKPLHLNNNEKDDLLAFLNSLTSEVDPVRLPILPPRESDR